VATTGTSAPVGALLLAATVARDVHPQAIGEVRARAVEQRRRQAVVAAHERAQIRGVLLYLAPGDERGLLAGARVAGREQAREVAVAARRLDQQQQRVGAARLVFPRDAPGGSSPAGFRVFARLRLAARNLQRGPDDCAQPGRARGLVEARNPVEPAAVGERERRVAPLGRDEREVFGVGRRLEKRERAAAAQLDVIARRGARGHPAIFASCSPPSTAARTAACPSRRETFEPTPGMASCELRARSPTAKE
jgi:hypothetical protein